MAAAQYYTIPTKHTMDNIDFQSLEFENSDDPKFFDTGQHLCLNRSWNLYTTSTHGTKNWYTHKINKGPIQTVETFWKYMNMFFPSKNHDPIMLLDLENNNRKEISFFQEDVYPNWDIIKKMKRCKSLHEMKISCKNKHLDFVLYIILSLVGESFGSDEDESYIQNIVGIRICPYTKPSIRLWLMNFTPQMFQSLETEMASLWKNLHKTKFIFSTRSLSES